MSRIYTGTGRLFQEVKAIPLDEEALIDIERRVKLQPHFLGEPLVVIGDAQDFPGVISPDSHDLIALDASGRTVAISLTIGVADVESDTHSLQLAAHLNGMHSEDLGKIGRSFIGRLSNDSMRRSWEELGVEMSEESIEITSLLAATFGRDAEDFSELINTEQRVVIAAEGFTSRLVNVILWLNRSGVNIIGLQYRKYLVGGTEVYFAEQVVPTLDPAVDAPEQAQPTQEMAEPWRHKGRVYHAERLTPSVAALLDELIVALRESTFIINWSHKYYFWIRGPRRNLRIRTYHRDRLEIGFYNASPEAIQEFLEAYGLGDLEISTIGGYTDSPFVALSADMRITDRWVAMLNDWLIGATPGQSVRGTALEDSEATAPSSEETY